MFIEEQQLMTIPKTSKTKKAKGDLASLIIEQHPVDYIGPKFITLIQYRKQPLLAIVDNIKNGILYAFVLDLCAPAGVEEEMIISAATDWYNTNRTNFPVSIEFSQRGLTPHTSRIYRALNVEFISRVIGPIPKYSMATTKSVKRRRRKPLPVSVEIHRVEKSVSL